MHLEDFKPKGTRWVYHGGITMSLESHVGLVRVSTTHLFHIQCSVQIIQLLYSGNSLSVMGMEMMMEACQFVTLDAIVSY